MIRRIPIASGALLVVVAAFGAALALYSDRQAAIAEAQVPAIGEFVEIDGVRLHYVKQGSGSPVVLIHGLAGNLRNFTGTIAADLAKTHTVIAIDRPGSGYSAPLPGGNASVQEQAAFIQRALQQLGIERPILVGHSLGGAVSLAYALQYPAETKALVLVAPATVSFTPQPPVDKLNIGSPLMQTLLAHTLAVPASMRSGPETVRAIFAPDEVPVDFAIAGGAALSRRPAQVKANFRDFSQLGAGLDAMKLRYSELALPVRIIFGTKDGVLQPEAHLQPFAGMKNVAVSRIDGAGHMLPYSQPGAILAAVAAVEGE
jgi:pimeloyl-ACP methyl ester carboxylesterase